jgi:hypothetical protein
MCRRLKAVFFDITGKSVFFAIVIDGCVIIDICDMFDKRRGSRVRDL